MKHLTALLLQLKEAMAALAVLHPMLADCWSAQPAADADSAQIVDRD
jgi:hypothetical protein